MHEEALRVLLDGQLLNDEFLHIIAPPAIRGAATGALALGPGPVLLLVLVVVEIAVLLLPVRSPDRCLGLLHLTLCDLQPGRLNVTPRHGQLRPLGFLHRLGASRCLLGELILLI